MQLSGKQDEPGLDDMDGYEFKMRLYCRIKCRNAALRCWMHQETLNRQGVMGCLQHLQKPAQSRSSLTATHRWAAAEVLFIKEVHNLHVELQKGYWKMLEKETHAEHGTA